MKTFKELLESLGSKTAVVTYGRMSPPTIGHQKLIDHVFKQKGDHHIIVSHTQDNKKNPLHVDEKLELLRKSNPKHASAFKAASKESPTLFHHAAALHKAGYHHLHVVVGADRVEEFKTNLNKYNGKDYHFKSIKVSSAGDRDPDAEGAEGMSASKMRAHALSGNKTEFLKGLHPALHTHADELMKKIRDRIK